MKKEIRIMDGDKVKEYKKGILKDSKYEKSISEKVMKSIPKKNSEQKNN